MIARKKNNDWWLGVINSLEKRSIEISLDFLGKEKYKAIVYMDDASTEKDPNHLSVKEMQVSGSDRLILPLNGSGGAAIRFVLNK